METEKIFNKYHSPAILIVLVLLSVGVQAQHYSGGTGHTNNPYRIKTAENMNEISSRPNDWDGHFILINDIGLPLRPTLDRSICLKPSLNAGKPGRNE